MDTFLSNLLPIVVLYNQKVSESVTIKTLNDELKQIGRKLTLFVYDNSSLPDESNKNNAFESFEIHYVSDTQNSGLSTAYNSGVRYARENSKEWVLLLDQDTTFNDLFLAFASAIHTYPQIKVFAPVLMLNNDIIFSPNIPKHKRGYLPKSVNYGINNLYKLSPVNSGLLIRTDFFESVGGYNPKVKVDFCDFQFLEKVRLKNPEFVIVKSIGIQDFSSADPSKINQLKRFQIYLNDAINCNKPTISDKFGFLYTVTRHTLGLTYKHKSLQFLQLFLRKYL